MASTLAVAGNLTASSLFKMSDNTSTKFLVADGTSYQEVAMSGDATMANTGAITIANDAVTYAKMQNLGTADRVLGSTSTGVIGEVQIVADMIATGAVVAAKIGADAVTAAKIGDDVINSEHYAAGSIDREHLAADIIDGTKIADDVINSEHYVHGSIDALHIADDTITEAKMANDAIGQNELKTVQSFRINDSGGNSLFLMYGAGA
jgi:hypothetical protein